MTKPVARDNPYAVLRNRDFLFFAIGRFIASFGQQMLTVAVGWELYQRTHSSMALGVVGLTQFLPMLVMTIPAGHVADTRNRKNVILCMQLVLTLASAGLALISHYAMPVNWIYGCLLVSAIARTFLWSASASFLPQLVSREEFPRAINWATSTFQFSAVTGPAIAGFLIDLANPAGTPKPSAALIYIITAVTTGGCFALVCFVKPHHKPPEKQPMTLKSLLGGFHFVFNSRVILAIISLDLFAVLFGGATTLLPVYAEDILHCGAKGYGLLNAALPIGSLVCALYMAHRPPMEKAGRSLCLSVIIFGLATVIFGLSTSFWLSLAMMFICGFADNVSVIVRHTLVQLLTPDAMRGRVSSVNNLFIGTSNELGGFESGAVSAWRGPVFSVVSGGIATVLVVFGVAWIWPEIPKFGKLVQPAEPKPAVDPEQATEKA